MLPEAHLADLDALASSYWWHVVRTRHVAGAVDGSVRSYLDLGCGPGATTREVARAVGASRVVGLDFDPRLKDPCRKNGVEFHQADLEKGVLALSGERFDFWTAMDVLEHLNDPAELLRGLRPSLAEGAVGVVTVPAFPFLFSDWDRALGHRRRYTRGTLRELLEGAGYTIHTMRFLYGFAFLPAILRRKKKAGNAEFPRVAAPLNAFLKFAGTHEPPMPFGTTLLAVVRS